MALTVRSCLPLLPLLPLLARAWHGQCGRVLGPPAPTEPGLISEICWGASPAHLGAKPWLGGSGRSARAWSRLAPARGSPGSPARSVPRLLPRVRPCWLTLALLPLTPCGVLLCLRSYPPLFLLPVWVRRRSGARPAAPLGYPPVALARAPPLAADTRAPPPWPRSAWP